MDFTGSVKEESHIFLRRNIGKSPEVMGHVNSLVCLQSEQCEPVVDAFNIVL